MSSITINANSNDITKEVEWESFEIENNLTSQVDTCSFSYRKYGSRSYTPTLGHVVQILQNATEIFEGKIVKINSEVEGKDVLTYAIECQDYTVDLDAQLVSNTYETQSVEDIITDIIADYTAGFTTTNVSCTTEVKYIAFPYVQVSKCLQQLAELVGYEWYVDYDKDIHFFAKGDELSPFNLTDTNNTYIYRSLKLTEDYRNIRNKIFIRGSTYIGSSIVERIVKIVEPDVVVDTIEKYAEEPSVWLDGVAQNVGLDNIDDPNSYDCLWNYGEKHIRFREDNKPTLLQEVQFRGYPEIPIVLWVSDSSSIATYGEREFRITDKSIKTKEGANQRAQAELTAYAEKVEDGFFTTYQSGLISGQQININSTIRGVSENYIIKKVRTSLRAPDRFTYDVSLITERVMGIIDYLQRQLMKEDIIIEQPTDELVAIVKDITETITMEDTTHKQSPPYRTPLWVWGPYVPTAYVGTVTGSDRLRAARYDASCTFV